MAIQLRKLKNKLRRPNNATQRAQLSRRDFLRRQQPHILEANPLVTLQPLPLSVTVGQPATFTCEGYSVGLISYQWYKNAALVANETSTTYTIDPTVIGDNGAQIYCEVTDATNDDTASVNSNTVTLTVTL